MGQANQPELGAAVSDVARPDARGGDTADIDDASAVLRLHDGEGRAGAEERGAEVGSDNVVPGLGGDLVQRGGMEKAGVVHQDVESTEAGQRLFKKVGYIRLDFNVSWDDLNVAVKRPDDPGGRLKAFLSTRGQDEAGALPGEGDSDGLADTAAGAGDQGDFTVELTHDEPP